MSLRTRLLLAFAAVVLIPIALLAFGLRQEMIKHLSAEYQLRVDGAVEIIREDLARESAGIAERLSSLESALQSARGVAFVTTRGAEREFLALARAESLVIGGRTFTIIGGVAVDNAFLARLAHDKAIVVSLRYPGGELSTGPRKL